MTGFQTATRSAQPLPQASGRRPGLRHLTGAAALAAAAALVALPVGDGITLGPLTIDRAALFLATAVLGLSALVQGFAWRYMDGDRDRRGFDLRLGILTLAALVLAAADHMLAFLAAWSVVALVLPRAIGHVRGWAAADAAASLARRSLIGGTVLLGGGLLLLWLATGADRFSALAAGLPAADPMMVTLAALGFVAVVVVQCALPPAHGWLMASMTAPTPVSAFMHAGLVNAGGILMLRTLPVFEAVPAATVAAFAMGSLAMLIGTAASRAQAGVKRGLAASTSAQMGYMTVQAALGFPGAALAHLVLHGLYKASLFLGAGSALAGAHAPRPSVPVTASRLMLAWPAAVAAGAGFALVTGKLDATLGGRADTGAILVAIAGLAGLQLATGVLRTGARTVVVLLALPVAALIAGGLYGAVILVVDALTGVGAAPQPLAFHHLLLPVALLLGWGWIALGLDRRAVAAWTLFATAARPAAATTSSVTKGASHA
ncbi:proton-conducting transporter membrane subunit [uncultured Tistrella sp.]|uniref:proton-conducting transporter transmembrane domain-containing protein n=1 Tax=Tistrella mobilis TaxID=171437 RepID=UPI000C091893|nr:proton-conducting transporter membrane subunit [uncultured Tistrella sp.]MAM77250.1 hypothetical protein [Tistrella sp.]